MYVVEYLVFIGISIAKFRLTFVLVVYKMGGTTWTAACLCAVMRIASNVAVSQTTLEDKAIICEILNHTSHLNSLID